MAFPKGKYISLHSTLFPFHSSPSPLHSLRLCHGGTRAREHSGIGKTNHAVVDTLTQDFRVTRSGRGFSPWEGEAIQVDPTFNIADAVMAALDDEQPEDLAQPDTFDEQLVSITSTLDLNSADDVPPAPADDVPPAPSSISSTSGSTSTPSAPRKARDKAGSKLRCQAIRQSLKIQAHVNLLPPPRRPKHIKNAVPVKTKFRLMKQRVASTGWIGLCDDGQLSQEKSLGFEEPGWTPSHTLPDFFGTERRFSGFKYVEYLGPKTRPVLNAAGRVFAVFAGHADDPNWMRDVHDPAWRTWLRPGRRPSAGDSYGRGQIQPGALINGVINTAILCSLMSNLVFIRLAGFATGVPLTVPLTDRHFC
ncbi:hypothetical protein B0H16DRAFT_1837956 [Mycena metata]|uniref:Uncharacterized protein n=1 Tax=Mycena metata TaxID=1033252 RepID=A0AAD7K5K7_9AGAR|nr:hypothetical protein B0H16DRAFT_1837956 [Mycena metata]